MTTDSHALHPQSVDPAGDHAHDAASHGSLKSYLIGFGLSVVLTAIPFWLVMTGVLGSNQATAATIVGFAFAQIIVHMICFLHMDSKSEGGWTMLALIFTIVLVVITLSGSLWVMYHMTTNMMPSAQDMGKLP